MKFINRFRRICTRIAAFFSFRPLPPSPGLTRRGVPVASKMSRKVRIVKDVDKKVSLAGRVTPSLEEDDADWDGELQFAGATDIVGEYELVRLPDGGAKRRRVGARQWQYYCTHNRQRNKVSYTVLLCASKPCVLSLFPLGASMQRRHRSARTAAGAPFASISGCGATASFVVAGPFAPITGAGRSAGTAPTSACMVSAHPPAKTAAPTRPRAPQGVAANDGAALRG